MPKTKAIRTQLRKEAEARQAESDKLTVKQKLDRLPAIGANRQRARYTAAIEAAKNKPVEVAAEGAVSEKEKKASKEEKKRMKKESQ